MITKSIAKIISTCWLFFLTASLSAQNATKTPVIIDADTNNEVDDLYAFVSALLHPDWEVLALNVTQWQISHWAIPQPASEAHARRATTSRTLNPIQFFNRSL